MGRQTSSSIFAASPLKFRAIRPAKNKATLRQCSEQAITFRLDFGHLPATRWQKNGSPMRASWQGHGKPSYFVRSTSPSDLTEFPDGACPLLPGCKGAIPKWPQSSMNT